MVTVELEGWWYSVPSTVKGRRALIEAAKALRAYETEREAKSVTKRNA